ncbi:DNA polymerase epsilon subunit 3-like [Anneissia japonica]|uniref:DNA polymerase epsilon subunit 3-like n=1 Tax=Anneissia japonica TaxID=1529436 RepID=UPI001425985A|nr:DNA polymerase epsilon subunit 3-like [Anneissia japonica]
MAERPEDLNLPMTVISKIMRQAVPEGVSVSKEARSAVSRAASVFVLYATSCANNYALKAKRKTMNAADVFAAMKDMEFDEFLEPLQQSLDEFKKEQQDKKVASEKRKKSKTDSEKSQGETAGEDDVNDSKEMEEEEDDEDDANEEKADEEES